MNFNCCDISKEDDCDATKEIKVRTTKETGKNVFITTIDNLSLVAGVPYAHCHEAYEKDGNISDAVTLCVYRFDLRGLFARRRGGKADGNQL